MMAKAILILMGAAVAVGGMLITGCGGPETEPEPPGEHEHEEEPEHAAAPAGEISQKACPVMGRPIDPNIYVDHEGRRVYFCCQSCVAKFKADPGKYLAKLDSPSPAAEPEGTHGAGEHEH